MFLPETHRQKKMDCYGILVHMTSRRVAMAVSYETTCLLCTNRPFRDDDRSGVPSSSMEHDLPRIVLATSVTQHCDSSSIITVVWMQSDVANIVS